MADAPDEGPFAQGAQMVVQGGGTLGHHRGGGHYAQEPGFALGQGMHPLDFAQGLARCAVGLDKHHPGDLGVTGGCGLLMVLGKVRLADRGHLLVPCVGKNRGVPEVDVGIDQLHE